MINMTIKELLEGYKSKMFSPVEVTRDYLDKIKNYNPQYNAFITVTEETALSSAYRIEENIMSNQEIGILQGVPISYKDSIDTKGIKTTSGSLINKNRIPTEDANVVKMLNKSGVVNLGKANMYEFGTGITSDNPFYGSIKNPWNTRYMAGGSSGGSAAAVAANLSMASIGTDAGGSIRVPSACCGVVGLKPTYDLIQMDGIMPLSWTLDHVGPITRNVEDLAIIMEALTKKPNVELGRDDLQDLKIGIPNQYFNEKIDEEVREIYQKAIREFEKLGVNFIAVDIPFASESINVASTIATAEAGYMHKDLRKTSLDLYGEAARETFTRSQSISSFEYIAALKSRDYMNQKLTELYEDIDILLTPTLPALTTKLGVDEVQFGKEKEKVGDCMIRYTCLFDITGHPALSIPCGATKNSMPVGLQLVANHFREDLLIKTAYFYEKEYLTDFYKKKNEIFKQV
ncbi:amidase [Halobacillus naozhouensis]|uniref:Amidase n=1 Tax=Halobacillus naozhouensis TaxID=554880 RepID=A0ABY8IZC7_9BACI|nr:amidase [Halobacillus naozhouensis]WFT75570.1 amidase [Halobacillus naozhouensis]